MECCATSSIASSGRSPCCCSPRPSPFRSTSAAPPRRRPRCPRPTSRPTPARCRRPPSRSTAQRPPATTAPAACATPSSSCTSPRRPRLRRTATTKTPGRRPADRVGLGRLRRLPAAARSGRTGGTGGSGNGGSTPKPSSGDPLDVYHLSLRFGRAEATQLKTYHDVARLSPLPTADNPFFVYTGVLKDGKTAVFLLSSDATATGDGHCRPSAKSCQTIEVKEGDTEFFDLTVNGEAVQYQLDVVKVFKKGAASAAAAAASYERHSNAGADMLRKAHRVGSSAFKGAATYRWLPDSGVLVRTPQQSKARASVNGAAAASPADATGTLPGLPVWAWQSPGA